MNLPKLTDDLNIISSLSDKPTETSAELKSKFDRAGNIIKDFLNNILTENLKTELEAEIESMRNQITSSLNNTRPIGSLYITTTNENPSDIWVGTEWEKVEDVFLLATGKRALGSTGGEEEVQLSVEQMPPHKHRYDKTTGTAGTNYDRTYNGVAIEKITTSSIETTAVGEGKPINNMPPYLAVNVWKRVS